MKQPLSRSQIDAFEATLKKRLAVLRAETQTALVRSKIEHDPSLAGQVSDLKDAAFAQMIVNVDLADAERDAAEILAIDAALQRIQASEYGLCTECGDAIRLQRLQVSPAAARCYDCQQWHELRAARDHRIHHD